MYQGICYGDGKWYNIEEISFQKSSGEIQELYKNNSLCDQLDIISNCDMLGAPDKIRVKYDKPNYYQAYI